MGLRVPLRAEPAVAAESDGLGMLGVSGDLYIVSITCPYDALIPNQKAVPMQVTVRNESVFDIGVLYVQPIFTSGTRGDRNGDYSVYGDVMPNLVRAYQYHGMNLYSRNQYRKALEVWGKMLEVDRDNEKALRYMQRTRQELERFEGLIN